MKADQYSLTATMMKIADNPENPWLDEHLRSQGLTPYKFGEFKGLNKSLKKGDLTLIVAPTSPSTKDGAEYGFNQDLLEHLASKVSG